MIFDKKATFTLLLTGFLAWNTMFYVGVNYSHTIHWCQLAVRRVSCIHSEVGIDFPSLHLCHLGSKWVWSLPRHDAKQTICCLESSQMAQKWSLVNWNRGRRMCLHWSLTVIRTWHISTLCFRSSQAWHVLSLYFHVVSDLVHKPPLVYVMANVALAFVVH